MSLLQWIVAFDRFALAASTCPENGVNGVCVWSYAAALAHKAVVLEVCHLCVFGASFRVRSCLFSKVAARSTTGVVNRRPWLAIVYDRLARKQWHERTAANEALLLRLLCVYCFLRVFVLPGRLQPQHTLP